MKPVDVTKEIGREATAAAALIAELAMTDEEDVLHDIIEGETNLLEALDRAIGELDDCEIIAAGCKAKEAQIAARRGRAEARAGRIRSAVEHAMVLAELPSARLATATLTVKTVAPKPIVTDEAAIPAAYWKSPPPVLDKTALNAAAKVGPVPGVEMSNGGVSLQIRRA